MKNPDKQYQNLLANVLACGEKIMTRNHGCYSDVSGLQVKFNSTPLITLRKTAWKKAMREMEWFMSGDTVCPKELLNWWGSQLNPYGSYYAGYGDQLRKYTSWDIKNMHYETFDQIAFVLDALKNHPNSRRIITTTWHPEEMSRITEINNNPNTPSTCHGTLTQYFVRNNKLYMHSYQRSADLLLGVPHNWIQYWALLLYFAKHSNLEVGGMTWTFGDAHIYDDPTHVDCVKELLAHNVEDCNLEMIYNFCGMFEKNGVPIFKGSDFSIVGEIPLPVTNIKPKLF